MWVLGVGAGLAGGALAQSVSSTSAGHCLAFDGLQDFVHVPRTLSLEPGEITIEMWARLDGPQDWNSRLLRKGEHDAYFITADQDLDQHMQLLINRDHTIIVTAEDTQSHAAYIGTWHHFVGVYATDYAEFWVDGVRVSQLAHEFGPLTHLPLTDLYIGAGLPVTLQNEYFAGRIDEVRVWNYPRTPAEIGSSWNATLTGGEPGLVAYWRFDEGAGQTAADSSPLGNHGQLGASALAEASDPTWMVSGAPLGGSTCLSANYCVGGLNTVGENARIGLQGSLSIAANELVLTVSDVPPHHPGVFFFGRYATQIPFGEGYLCVTGQQHRMRPMVTVDGLGTGSLALDFADPLAPESVIAAGSQWNFQFWYRDAQPVGHGFNLSDALGASFCP
jgi:hypothetical protein